MNIITKYYKAWENQDIEAIETLLHKDVYGVRVFTEETFFTVKEVMDYLSKTKVKIDIQGIKQTKDIVTVELGINDQLIQSKVTIKDDKIYKLYEAIKSDKRRIKCTISYDGSAFAGYQKQPNQQTIQGTIETSIKKALDEDIIIHSSGRTDKGVHAINQVIHFDTDTVIKPDGLFKLLNSYMEDGIFIKSLEEVENTFHSRYDVKEKTYLYKINTKEFDVINRNYEWYVPSLNIDLLKESLKQIEGTHDFTTFTKTTDKSCVRTIYSTSVKEDKNYMYIMITGNGFLRFMVRNIVGALVQISQGKLQTTMTELLNSKDVNLLKDKAPATGLYLYNVTY